MTKNDALPIKQESAWQLLLEFVPADGPAGESRTVKRVTGAVRELGLQPVEVERIGNAVMEALQKATQRKMRDQHNSPLSIRVWISGVPTEDSLRSTSDAQRVGQQQRRGWGFFLVQRQEDDPQASAGKSHHLVEVYLYQER